MLQDLNQEKKYLSRVDKNVEKSTQRWCHLWFIKTYFLSHLWNHIYSISITKTFKIFYWKYVKNLAGKNYEKLFSQRRCFEWIKYIVCFFSKEIHWSNRLIYLCFSKAYSMAGLICFQEHTIHPRFVFGLITIFEGKKEGTKLQRKNLQ